LGGICICSYLQAIVTVALLIILILFAYINTRKYRSTHPEPPRLLPGFLKQKWRNWDPHYGNKYVRGNLGNLEELSRRSSAVPTTVLTEIDEIDRRRSVRSIVSLPPYRVAPLDGEQLIAREGERAGVDTVVEFPEDEAEAEAHREEEMAALYRIREVRREEQAARRRHREQRREAQLRGDWDEVHRLDRENTARLNRERAASNASAQSAEPGATAGEPAPSVDSDYLIAELASMREGRAWTRRVSAVSYAELGVARHDGSRVRADSVESDNRPLLDSAASMGGGGSRPESRAASRASSPGRSLASRAGGHVRSASHMRNVSDASNGSDLSTAGNALLTPQSSEDLPPGPPSYEDDISMHGGEAPPYESPIETTAPVLPAPASSVAAHHPDQHQRDSIAARMQATTHAASQEAANGTERPALSVRTSVLRRLPAIEVMSATPVKSTPASPVTRS
jgi:hypothetical protein